MKKLKRVLAILLTAAVTAGNIPLSASASVTDVLPDIASFFEELSEELSDTYVPMAEEASAGVQEVTVDNVAMRFVENSFDESTGVLSMDLQIKTSNPAEGYNGEVTGQSGPVGTYVDSGYFTFQIDPSLRPLLADGTTEVVTWSADRLAYVGSNNTVLSYIASGRGQLINEEGTDFEQAMLGGNGEQFHGYGTGMLVAYDNGLLDCYIHFCVNSVNDAIIATDAEGYSTVMTLNFKCYDGEEVASSNLALFENSITIPQSQSEIDAIAAKFNTGFQTVNPGQLLYMGGAGFSEKKFNGDIFDPDHLTSAVYYYYGCPTRDTVWNDSLWESSLPHKSAAVNNAKRVAVGTSTSDGYVPYHEYDNMTNTYIVNGFYAQVNNTYSTDMGASDPGYNPDFIVPTEEISNPMPRYRVPTQAQENAAAFTAVPAVRYGDDSSDTTQIPLKYEIGTTVTANSITRPELGEGGMDVLLSNLQWSFAHKGVGTEDILLNSYLPDKLDDFTEAFRVEGSAGNYYSVKEATIDDENSKYDGKKVWVVEDPMGGTNVSPVGVIMDFVGTPVSYLYEDEGVMKTKVHTGSAPQLLITSASADPDSYLWDSRYSGENGFIYFTVDYVPVGATNYPSSLSAIQVRIYKEESVADEVAILPPSQVISMQDPSGHDTKGLTIPVEPESDGSQEDISREMNDMLLGDGIPFTISLKNQYGFALMDNTGERPIAPTTVSIAPAAETSTAITANGKEANPFVLVKDEENYTTSGYQYYLKYNLQNSIITANRVQPGYYVITATHTDMPEDATLPLYMSKEPDKFTHMVNTVSVSVGNSSVKASEDITEVDAKIPAYGEAGGTVTFGFSEMANQWRDLSAESSQNAAEYDMFSDLRDGDGNMTLSLVNRHFDVDFSVTDASGKAITSMTGLDFTNRVNGVIAYRTDTVDGSVIYVNISAKVKGSSDAPIIKKYKITFNYDTLKLMSGTAGIKVSNAATTVDVPEEGKTAVPLIISAGAYNQYNKYWDWETTTSSGVQIVGVVDQYNSQVVTGRRWLPWKLLVDGVTYTDGVGRLNSDSTVTFTDSVPGSGHCNQVNVTSSSEAVDLTARVVFQQEDISTHQITSEVSSAPFTISVSRGQSIPARVESIVYSSKDVTGNITAASSTVTVPTNNNLDVNGEPTGYASLIPQIVVKDQFGAVMDPSKYTVKWGYNKDINPSKIQQELQNHPKVQLDENTGVITVAPCAAAVSDAFSVRATICDEEGNVVRYNNNTVTFSATGLKILRNQPKNNDVFIGYDGITHYYADGLDYPDSSTADKYYDLKAYLQDWYYVNGETMTLAESSTLTWTLDSVVLNDGSDTVIERLQKNPAGAGYLDDSGAVTNDKDEAALTGDIILNAEGVYQVKDYASMELASVGNANRDGGRVYLNTATSRANAPKSFTVSVIAGEFTDELTININWKASEANYIEIYSSCYTNVTLTVPTAQDPEQEWPLNAYVRDQYGFNMEGEKVMWSVSGTGVRIGNGDDDKNILYLNYQYPTGSPITFTASYVIKDENGAAVDVKTASRSIAVNRPDSVATTLSVIGISGQSVISSDGFTVTLPGMNNRAAYLQGSFSLVPEVRDQYTDVRSKGDIVKYEVVSDPYNMIIGDVSGGTVRFACNDDWRTNCDQDVTLKIRAYLYNSANEADRSIQFVKEITLVRQPDKAAYAVPEMTSDYSQSDMDPDHILIPSPDDIVANAGNGHNGKSHAVFTAKVYSQYNTEMPGEGATISVVTADSGFTMIPDVSSASAVLEVSNITSVSEAQIAAVPEDTEGILTSEVIDRMSTISVYLDRGSSYAAVVALGEGLTKNNGLEVDNNNETSGELDTWTVSDPNIPPDPSDGAGQDVVVGEFTFAAWIADQYNANYLVKDSAYYPVWTLAENYDGIYLKDDAANTDSAGNVRGKLVETEDGRTYYEVTLCVAAKALGANVTRKSITLNLTAARNGTLNEKLKATQSFELHKNASVATHMFFEDVALDENGDPVLQTTWQRPTLAEGSVTYNVGTIIYDQYGYPYTGRDAVTSVTLTDRLLPNGYRMVPENYDPNEESKPGATASKYWIQAQDEQGGEYATVAEYEPATATVTLYTACKLTELNFSAVCNRINGIPQTIKVNLDNGAANTAPESLVINTEEGFYSDINFASEEDDDMQLTFSIKVYDQYGDLYTGSGAYPVWTLLYCTDRENGVYEAYQGYTEEGDPEDDIEKWFLALKPGATGNSSSGSNTVSLEVRPGMYLEDVDVRLVCELRDGDLTAPLLNIAAEQPMAVQKRSRKRPVMNMDGPYTISYNAGEHGTLSGASSEMVEQGRHATHVPTILPEPGWGVKGWLASTGELVQDPASVEVWGDMDFTVIYADITTHVFLTGYDNHTVRPNRAVTRAEFVTMVVRAINNYDSNKEYSHPFPDVDPARYYDSYVGYAFTLGIVSGDENGNFRPNDTITRAEAARMVSEAADITGKGIRERTLTFEDVDSDAWYADYVFALAEEGIINGYGDGTFRPGKQLSRAEAVTLLVQILREAPSPEELKRIRENGLSPFEDITKNDWSYPYILRAAGAA